MPIRDKHGAVRIDADEALRMVYRAYKEGMVGAERAMELVGGILSGNVPVGKKRVDEIEAE